MEKIKISVEIEEWVGVGVVYRIDKGNWMSEEEFFNELKKSKKELIRICPNKSKHNAKRGN